MKVIRLTFLVALMMGSIIGFSQDIHFSQFTASPISLNPALTGMFNGDYRVSGIYRNQWKSVTPNPYKTITAAADFGLFKSKLGQDFIGGGLMFYSDVAGKSEFGTNNVQLSATYHKALTQDTNQYISFGLRGGLVQRNINYANLRFGSQYDGEKYNKDLPRNESFSSTRSSYTYGDISGGLLWTFRPNQRYSLYAGTMLGHLAKPNQSHFAGVKQGLDRKLALHGGGQITINKQWKAIPSFMYLNQGKAQEMNLGSYFKFQNQLLSNAGVAFYAGGWYRFGDALIPAVKMDYKSVSVGFSYDINISSLTDASRYKGGPEISIVYIGAMPEEQGLIKQDVPCPRF